MNITETVVDDGLPLLNETCGIEKQGDAHVTQVLEIHRSKDAIILEVCTEEKYPKPEAYMGAIIYFTAKDCKEPTGLRVTNQEGWSAAAADLGRYSFYAIATRNMSMEEIQKRPCIFFDRRV